ncbi:MAG: membrane dipeptidase [Clostridiales bacterium]|nr:membrane dipeptidase [Clostridiales bacterium]
MEVFDLHCDTLYECVKHGRELMDNPFAVDLRRGRARYRRWAQVFAVWMPDFLRGEAAFDQCVRTLSFAHEQANRHAEALAVVRDASELEEALENQQCAALLSIEGGSALAGSLEHLEQLAALGVRIVTLTWNGSNELGHGSGSDCASGLTPFGRSAVRRMEALGVLPDVSHLNERGFWDVAKELEGPFIASHSNAAAVHPHSRNLTDAQFQEITRRGGLVGLNFCAEHWGVSPDVRFVEKDFDRLMCHLDHFLSLGGERTLCLGGDLDGTEIPDKWGGVDVYFHLKETLLRNRYEEPLLDRLFFGNCYDFFHSALTSSGRIG